jgi:hypothetical protein
MTLGLWRGADERSEIGKPARIPRLVVVPTEDLDEVPWAIVSPESKTHEAVELMMSLETSGSSEYSRTPASRPDSAAAL